MPASVAEHLVRPRRFGAATRVRVDLHGVSLFGRGNHRSLLRWEWIETIEAGPAGVVVSSTETSLTLPAKAFNLSPDELAARLVAAQSIVDRPEVIGALLAGLHR